MKHTKLYSCLYGSKLYGTSTPTSDLDWKHVVLPDLNDLLLGKKVQNHVKKTNIEKNVWNTVDDIDEEFVPLQVFARDFMGGQTYALELAFAVNGSHAEQHVFDENFKEFTTELVAKFLTSNVKALIGYVVNQANLYSFKGERYNVVEEAVNLFQAVNNKHGNTTSFNEVMKNDDIVTHFKSFAKKYPKYFEFSTYSISDNKSAPCFKLMDKYFPFSNSCEMSLKTATNMFSKYGDRAKQASETNVDWKAMMHALRIVDEGLMLLGQGFLSFPFSNEYVEYLLNVKTGKVPLDQVREELSTKLDTLKELEKTTTLKNYSYELNEEFEVWLTSWLRKFYNL